VVLPMAMGADAMMMACSLIGEHADAPRRVMMIDDE
jgi:hypothetical protein